MVTLLKVSNSEKQHQANSTSPPAYEDVIQQSDKYPTVDPRFPVPASGLIGQGKSKLHLRRPKLGRKPVQSVCHLCGMQNMTTVEYRTSFITHATAATIVCIGLWPVAWFPYVFDLCKTANHYCPQCYAYIGKE